MSGPAMATARSACFVLPGLEAPWATGDAAQPKPKKNAKTPKFHYLHQKGMEVDLDVGEAEESADWYPSTCDRSLVERGLWAIDSINPNAWSFAIEYLKHTTADFVRVQEVKVGVEGIKDCEQSVWG